MVVVEGVDVYAGVKLEAAELGDGFFHSANILFIWFLFDSKWGWFSGDGFECEIGVEVMIEVGEVEIQWRFGASEYIFVPL